MKSRLLLPNRYKLIGLILAVPSLVLGVAIRFFDFTSGFLIFHAKTSTTIIDGISERDYTDEVALTGIIIGLLLIAFSREKQEDEFINKLRLESLQWAVLINYILLIVASWLVYELAYIDVMMYNMLTVLLLFIIRFHIVLWKNKYSADHLKA